MTAFTITRDTLENNGILFIRDVLRNTLTDPSGAGRATNTWILKSPVKNEDISLPSIILDQSTSTERKITFNGGFDITYSLGVMVWARKLEERDDLADLVKVTLQNDSNTDSVHSLYNQGLVYLNCESRNADGYIEGITDLLRIKEMTINFRYMLK